MTPQETSIGMVAKESAAVQAAESLKYGTWIEVNTLQLRENLRLIKARLAGDKKVMAVVKANAYGHGLSGVAKALADQVDYFAVSNVTEGVEIRSLGISTPVLVMGMCLLDNELALKHNISLSISSLEIARAIDQTAARLGVKARVHIKVDTGMGRLGLSYRSAFQNILKIRELPNLILEGIYTHFTLADDRDSSFTEKQIDLFEVLLNELAAEGVFFSLVHTSNSAAVINRFDSIKANMVRPGLLLYGYGPEPSLPPDMNIKPVLALKAKVLFIKEVEAGKAVSYRRSFEAAKRTRIGVLPIGYSHGFPFSLSGKVSFLCKGKFYPMAGRICMDYIMVDLGFDREVTIGDELLLIGNATGLTAYALAALADTIPYEILTGLHERLPRVYLQ